MNTPQKTVILGVTGSIAAYKMADVASALAKAGVDTQVILTENGARIIQPIVFSTLTGNRCITKTFDDTVNYNVAHIALARRAEVLLVAPATANIIAKLACGIADDMLTTTALACTCTKLIAPAMNTHMWENPVVQDNLKTLIRYGWQIIAPDSGVLACKDTGAGKLPKPEVLTDWVLKELYSPKDLCGKNVLITAGPTQEAIDPVRYISNHSSGKMGYALAKNAVCRGANVTLVTGPTNLKPFPGVTVVPVTSAQDMYEAVLSRAPEQDIIIKAAAVADFTPENFQSEKVKKKDGVHDIKLRQTRDILKTLGEHKKPGQFLCGFAMETKDLIENSRAKLTGKHADMICANNLRTEGAGFQTDTNVITMLTPDGVTELPKLSKEAAAEKILDEILKRIN